MFPSFSNPKAIVGLQSPDLGNKINCLGHLRILSEAQHRFGSFGSFGHHLGAVKPLEVNWAGAYMKLSNYFTHIYEHL